MNVDDTNVKKMIKLKKLKKAKINQNEKKLLDVKDSEQLTDLVNKDVTEKIQSIESKIAEYNANLTEENKKKKKNFINKLKYLKKVLKTPQHLDRRVKLLKVQRRTAQRKEKKIQKIQDKLKKMKLKCLFCKKKGHVVAECKEKNENNEENNYVDNITYTSRSDKICFNCGKNDHSIYSCNLPVDMKNLPFADCFVCKAKGHLASHCPQSDKGIYIKGGSCFNCNSKEHLAKNCPTKQTQIHFENEKKENTLPRNNKLKKKSES